MRRLSLTVVSVGLALWASALAQAGPYMIVGNDEKVFLDAAGKVTFGPAGKDSVLVVDLADPLAPRIVANLPLKNSVIGPPVNVAISPTGTLALVTDSMDTIKDGDKYKPAPDNKLHVIDLASNPPKLVQTMAIGKVPLGLSFHPSGALALVADREDKSVIVLSIKGTDVKIINTVPMTDSVVHVEVAPDGKRALAIKSANHKVALLDIEGDVVTYSKLDLPTGQFPYNVAFTPNGKLALTADIGNAGNADGNIDTITVIDIEATPPRVIDRVVVGDAPEGLAISPKGDVAVAALLLGSIAKGAWFETRNGRIEVLRIDGKKVTKIKEIDVGALPEAVVFTPDGKYIYVGNYLDQDFSILHVNGTDVTDTGKRFKVPGHPASARMSRN